MCRLSHGKYKNFIHNFHSQITQRLGIAPNNKTVNNTPVTPSTIRNSKINADLKALDQLVSSLLDRQKQSPTSTNARESTKLSRLKSLSFRNRRSSNKANQPSNELNMFTSNNNGFGQTTAAASMPTILEGGSGGGNVVASTASPQQSTSAINSSSLDRPHRGSGVRQILNSIKNAPHRFSHSLDGHQRLDDEETNNLTRNMLD